MSCDVNRNFASLACIFLVGGIVAATQVGISALFISLLMCYVLLVATNAISRGEAARKRK